MEIGGQAALVSGGASGLGRATAQALARAGVKVAILDLRAAAAAEVAKEVGGLAVACECMFAWYWLADLCQEESIPFVLGHALYMKAIHGGKAKTDKIDAHKIAVLLRGGMLPQAYVYPKGMRETRDLLRRRMYLVHKRAELITHLEILNAQNNLPPFGKKLAYAANRAELDVPRRVEVRPHVDAPSRHAPRGLRRRALR